jgi:hypothetical protein
VVLQDKPSALFFNMARVFFWHCSTKLMLLPPFPVDVFSFQSCVIGPLKSSLTVAILLTAGAQTVSQLWATLGLIRIKKRLPYFFHSISTSLFQKVAMFVNPYISIRNKRRCILSEGYYAL